MHAGRFHSNVSNNMTMYNVSHLILPTASHNPLTKLKCKKYKAKMKWFMTVVKLQGIPFISGHIRK